MTVMTVPAASATVTGEDISNGVTMKPATTFRNYTEEGADKQGATSRMETVRKLYKEQHSKQTYHSVKELHKRYFKWNTADSQPASQSLPTDYAEPVIMGTPTPSVSSSSSSSSSAAPLRMSAWTALEYLDQVIDDSDPDTELSQIQHALQAAEAARQKFPNEDWMHLVALIHDLGKILSVVDPAKGLRGEPQWAVVGDTFPLGCAFDNESNIYPEYFEDNPDYHHPVYSTKCGIYKEHCGLRNATMSFGHDEYMYQVLVNNNCTLPAPGLACVRFHSFYPWHERGGYRHLCDQTDEEHLKWVKAFNSCDLYSKADEPCDVAALKPYYLGLMEKYLPAELVW